MGEVSGSHVSSPLSLAFDSNRNLYVVNGSLFFGGGDAVKFDWTGSTYSYAYQLASNRFSVAVDPSTDHVYLAGEEGEIEEFNPTGKRISTFGLASGYGSGADSIGVNKNTGQVYLAPPNSENQIWSGDKFIPNVATGSAGGVAETVATVHGNVDPEVSEGGSNVTSCEFEYGTTTSYDHTAACLDSGNMTVGTPGNPITGPIDVHAAVTKLNPSTTYYYRLVAKNAEAKEGQGNDATFTTFGPPSISGELSIARTKGATVEAQINPYGYPATCAVEYLTDAAYQANPSSERFNGAATVPCAEPLAAGFGDQTVSAKLSGLTIGTVYHYRFLAHNGATTNGGTTEGTDQTLSTFGIESFSVELLDEKGNPYTQAGSHPYEMKIKLALTKTAPETTVNPQSVSANLRTVKVKLPPGLVGNPTATPRCKQYQLTECAPTTEVGWAGVATARQPSPTMGGMYNLAPPPGVAAELGGSFLSIGSVRIDAGVRTGSDYGIEADTLSVTALNRYLKRRNQTVGRARRRRPLLRTILQWTCPQWMRQRVAASAFPHQPHLLHWPADRQPQRRHMAGTGRLRLQGLDHAGDHRLRTARLQTVDRSRNDLEGLRFADRLERGPESAAEPKPGRAG